MCSQIGYSTGYAVCCNAFGYHYQEALYTNFSCTGNETDITQCSRDHVASSAGRCNYASVICVNATAAASSGKRLGDTKTRSAGLGNQKRNI